LNVPKGIGNLRCSTTIRVDDNFLLNEILEYVHKKKIH